MPCLLHEAGCPNRWLAEPRLLTAGTGGQDGLLLLWKGWTWAGLGWVGLGYGAVVRRHLKLRGILQLPSSVISVGGERYLPTPLVDIA